MANLKTITAKKGSSKKKIAKKAPRKYTVRTLTGTFRIDSTHTNTLVRVGKISALNAIRASKALGLPITYIEKGYIYRESANGVREVLSKVPKQAVSTPLKKGMVLHAKK